MPVVIVTGSAGLIGSETVKFYCNKGYRDINLSILETTSICQEITGNKISIEKESATMPADMIIYIGDNKKVASETGWSPKQSPKNT